MTDRLLIYCSLLSFLLLLSLKWDGHIECDYWMVFTPLWLWKLIAITSTLAATYIWHRQPQYRFDADSLIEYKSMMMSISLHLLLLVFEVLVCDNLETAPRDRNLWTVICIPLLALCLLSIVVCIWSVKHDRPFEMELLCAISVLQLILVALQLDKLVQWSWVMVFVPLWVLLCLALIGVLYSIIFALILARTPEVTAEQRSLTAHAAISYTLLVLPFVAFLGLLTNKLDEKTNMSYTATCIPLVATFIVLLLLSFSCKAKNTWLFGSRQDLCRLLITACPLLQEYGNISYRLHNNNMNNNNNNRSNNNNTGLAEQHNAHAAADAAERASSSTGVAGVSGAAFNYGLGRHSGLSDSSSVPPSNKKKKNTSGNDKGQHDAPLFPIRAIDMPD